jgi:hypothetical protein
LTVIGVLFEYVLALVLTEKRAPAATCPPGDGYSKIMVADC